MIIISTFAALRFRPLFPPLFFPLPLHLSFSQCFSKNLPSLHYFSVFFSFRIIFFLLVVLLLLFSTFLTNWHLNGALLWSLIAQLFFLFRQLVFTFFLTFIAIFCNDIWKITFIISYCLAVDEP